MFVTFESLYGPEKAPQARARAERLSQRFVEAFGAPPEGFFSAPGRTELGGNHTDHQHGHVLCAAVDLDLLAAVRPNGTSLFRLESEGFAPVRVDLSDLSVHPGERGATQALIRGVAAGLVKAGADLRGAGVDVAVTSQVPAGSGLSSSAAFEVLIGTILGQLFLAGQTDPVTLARIGQFAENEYFGKPCGLMDQTACAVGGAVAIDFADPQAPQVERVDLDLAAYGYALCILDSGADHADLTDEYAAITREMKAVSGFFSRSVLRDVPEEEFLSALPRLRNAVGDRAVLRALHFFREDRRALQEAEALKAGDFPAFLELVRASGRSSALYLQNVVPAGAVERQALMVTLALAEGLLDGSGAVRVHGSGAVRVHGGGFGGTAQAFVPLDRLGAFRAGMEALLGPGRCHVVNVRPVGGVRLH